MFDTGMSIVVGFLEIYKWVILVTVLLSWLPMLNIHIPPHHPAVQFLHRITEPILAPLRPFCRMGGLDLSPIVAFFIIGFVQNILRGQSIANTLAFAISLVIAFSVHEFAHAFVADRLGDPTPRNQGRLTLDPRKHLDVLGSIMVLAVGFGWAKPVEVNPYYLKNGPKAGMATVAVAGPLSNLVLAGIASIPFRWVEPIYQSVFFPNPQELLYVFIWLNVVLVFFNLLPIHPLDGFKVVEGLLPYNAAQNFRKLAPIGPLLLLLLIFFGGSVFRAIVITPTNLVVGFLI